MTTTASAPAACPSENLLRRLLDDGLAPTEARAVEDHVQDCPACQLRLDHETTDRALTAARPPAPPLRFPPADDFLAELRSTPVAPMAPVAAPLPAIPGYQLVRELGRGGMGVVYLARQDRPDRLVALKLVHATADAGVRARFRREAEAVARLHHPGIVRIHEVGEFGGWPYLTLEYIDGPSLDRATNGTPWAPRAASELVERIARAVDAAHRAGVIHRDLKPANILIAADGTPVVTDFGLAKLRDAGSDHATRSGQLLGTPGYVAPEQIAGLSAVAEVTPAADVWALGAVLYELLTGRSPFAAPLPVDTLLQALHREPVPPSRVAPGVPKDLETVCLHCLHKSPDARYPTADALANDLRRFLDGLPVQARPLGRFGRLARWVRRHPSTAGLIAVAALAAAAGAAELAWRWREAERRAEVEGRAHRAADRRAAELAIDRHLAMCEQGEVARGLAGLAGVAAALSPEDADLDWAIRANLAAWRNYLVPRRHTLAHPADVTAAGFAPDGRLVVTGCRDGFVRTWNAADGTPAGPPMALGAEVTAIAIRPDGRAVAVAGADKSVRAFTLPDGRPLGRTITAAGPVVQLAFHPDGDRLATANGDGPARLWNVATGTAVGLPLRHDGPVEAVAFSPEGKQLLTGGADGLVKAWDAETAAALATVAKHRTPVRFVAHAPDGSGYATGSRTELIGSVAPLAAGHKPRPLHIPGHVTALAYDPSGGFLVCGGAANEQARGVAVYRLSGTEVVARMFPHEGVIRSAGVGPDARQLLAGGEHWRASLWLQPFERSMHLRLEHPAAVSAVAFRADFARLLTASGPAAYLWDAPPPPDDGVPLPQRGVTRLRVAADGRALAVGGGTARSWEPSGRPSADGWGLSDATAWADGDAAVWAAGAEQVVAHDRSTGKPSSVRIPIAAARALAAGRRTVAAAAGDSIHLFETATGAPLGPPVADAGRSDVLALSPAEDRLASGGPDGILRLRLVPVSGRADELPHRSPIRAVAFSPDGNRVAVGCQDKTVHLWNVADRTPAASPLVLSEAATQLAWHPDGRVLAVLTFDGTVRFWDSATGKPLGPPLLWTASAVAFSADGRHLLVGSTEFDIRSWVVPVPVSVPASGLTAWVEASVGEGR